MEREGRDHYDNQYSYYNSSHRRSRNRPCYKEDDYDYYYNESEDNYRRLCPILRNAVRFEEEERPRDA